MKESVTFLGNKLELSGCLPAVGTSIAATSLTKADLCDVELQSYKGSKLVLNIFPSIDTDVCASSVRKFNELASKLDGVKVLCISQDLPFASHRFCAAEGLDKVETLSAFRSNFAKVLGLEIETMPLKGLCARAIVVLDENLKVVYTELVSEVTHEPNYEKALESLK